MSTPSVWQAKVDALAQARNFAMNDVYARDKGGPSQQSDIAALSDQFSAQVAALGPNPAQAPKALTGVSQPANAGGLGMVNHNIPGVSTTPRVLTGGNLQSVRAPASTTATSLSLSFNPGYTPPSALTTGADSVTAQGNLANVLGQLSSPGGYNVYGANSGGGVGSSDTSLPAPSAADVASLQPTVTPTSSSGPSTLVIILIFVVLGGLGYWYWKKHHE